MPSESKENFHVPRCVKRLDVGANEINHLV